MFGHLRVAACRLGPEARADYHAHFCAGCHALAGAGGRLAALTTNYDQTVLAVVLGTLVEDRPPQARRCTALPWRRVPVRWLPAPARDYLAALNLAVVEAKLRDDIADEGGLRSRLGRLAFGSRARRAATTLRRLGFPVELLEALPASQGAVERRQEVGLEALAAPSAALMAEGFGHAAVVCGHPRLAAPLRRLGAALGRFVYVWDAVVDRDADRHRRRFNALDAAFGASADAKRSRAYLDAAIDDAEAALCEIPPSPGAGAVGTLLATLRARVQRRLTASPPIPVQRSAGPVSRDGRATPGRREAGDCDCCDCDCCCCGSGGDGCNCCSWVDAEDAVGWCCGRCFRACTCNYCGPGGDGDGKRGKRRRRRNDEEDRGAEAPAEDNGG